MRDPSVVQRGDAVDERREETEAPLLAERGRHRKLPAAGPQVAAVAAARWAGRRRVNTHTHQKPRAVRRALFLAEGTRALKRSDGAASSPRGRQACARATDEAAARKTAANLAERAAVWQRAAVARARGALAERVEEVRADLKMRETARASERWSARREASLLLLPRAPLLSVDSIASLRTVL